MKDGEQRLIWSEGVSRPIPCSERSVQVKLARKFYDSQRQKKNLDGLYEVLAPGSTVCKVSPTTSVIKEPNRQEVRMRNSDIAKFCISTAIKIARSLKMRIPKRNAIHDDALANRHDITQIFDFSPPVPIEPPPHNPNVAGPSAARVASPQMPTPILRKKEKRQLTMSDTSDSDTSSVRKGKRTLKR